MTKPPDSQLPGNLPPATLAYAPGPVPRRRRTLLRLGSLIALAIAGVAGWHWGPSAWWTGTALYWQDRCLNHRWPTGTVVLDSATPVGAARSGLWPRCWEQTKQSRRVWDGEGAVFVHRRSYAGREGKLVGVEFRREMFDAPSTVFDCSASGHPYLRQQVVGQLTLSAAVERVGTWRYPPGHPPPSPSGYPMGVTNGIGGNVYILLSAADRLRLFAGIPDSNDPSRFTIPFEFNGECGVIEGVLGEFDHVYLNVASGPKVLSFPHLPSRLPGG